MNTLMSGKRATMRTRMSGRTPVSALVPAPRRSSPAVSSSFATVRRSATSRNSSRERSSMRMPASVTLTVRPARAINGAPISRSSVRICCATAAGVMLSRRAAAAIDPRSTTVTNVVRNWVFMGREKMTLRSHINKLAALLLLAPALALAAPRGGNLVAIQAGTLPAIREDTITRVVAADDRLVALGQKSTWILEKGGSAWSRVQWRPDGEVLDAASDGRQAILLIGSTRGPIEKAERLSVASGAPTTHALPAFPMPLSAARVAVRSDAVYVAGTDANGMPRLLAIDPGAADPKWTTHA